MEVVLCFGDVCVDWSSILLRSYSSQYAAIFFFKQKTAYEMRISDWSSDVCSSDLLARRQRHPVVGDAKSVPPAEAHRHQPLRRLGDPEIGRASCRERVCQYV